MGSTLKSLLITGTDTDAGKTVLTTALAAYWQKYCGDRTLAIFKPVQSGVGDREHYSRLFSLNQSLEELNPLFFTAPLAPPLAAVLEGRKVALEQVWQTFQRLSQNRDFVLVEGVGGLGSPITSETTVADLAWDWRLPTILVVPVRLGAIGQAVANVALARQSRVHLKGIILNCVKPCSDEEIHNWASTKLIQALTQVPILGTLPYLPDITDLDKLTQAASGLELECFFPV
jgi:dethiobiotin synthetase